MSNSREGAKQDVGMGQWVYCLAEFTRENRGAQARLAVVAAETDVGYHIETEDLPFDSVAADIMDSMPSAVWITFGPTPEHQIAHGVHDVTAIRMTPATADWGAILEVESKDGIRTVLELSIPPGYARPGADTERGSPHAT